jgi:hypothetical protein
VTATCALALLGLTWSTGPVAIASTDSQATSRLAAATVYCTRHRRPKGCVDIPKRAKRPRGVDQQGSKALTPKDVVNGGGLGGGPGADLAAVEWARSQRGLSRWAWRCERFVEEAFGTRGEFPTAAAAAAAMPLTRGSVKKAPPGALVYFRADSVNRGYGHVGISLGDGRVISALSTVTVTDVPKSRYWRELYQGWAEAPKTWPGRIPPPPGPTLVDPDVGVRITAPAPTQTVSGTIELTASATNAGGVAFDAYYATDPTDPDTRTWVHLGTARQNGSYWTFSWDTARLPDQGNGPWGTVNLAAVALNARGGRTGTRDYRRVTIDNGTGSLVTPQPTASPSPTPTPPPGPTRPETTGGWVNTWTDYRSAGGDQGESIPPFTTVDVGCRVEGFAVESGNTWWYRLAAPPNNDRFFASADGFYNNGQTSGSLVGTPFVDDAVPLC